MPSTRTPSRPGPGPGRGRPRTRSTTRSAGSTAIPRIPETAPAPEALSSPTTRRPSITARAIALAVVLLILTISYASSLRIYFAQAHEIASTRAEIAMRQERISTLHEDLRRWDDPAYVRTQARDRLGWVVPGETGFKVVGADGRPLGGGARIEPDAPVEQPRDAWWAQLWGSVEAADKPAPPKAKPKPEKPITVDTPKR